MAGLTFVLFTSIVYANAHDLIYFFVKVFLHSILSIFFSSVEVLGKQNIPDHGPMIFSGNHMNQFVDGAVLLVTSPQRVGFLVAAKSFSLPVIGDLARATKCIPVNRPQDYAKKGIGKVKVIGKKLFGEGTNFKSFIPGEKIRVGRSPDPLKLFDVISDTEASVQTEEKLAGDVPQDEWLPFDILSSVDQSKMFESVHSALAKGNNLGIFPEGGSHDNTDLLPLKVGIAAIAFGTLEKYDMSVPIVPVGLNYFRGHRFRGRVVIEYGEPIRIDRTLFAQYKENRRAAQQDLLNKVEMGMRNVLVTAPDYESLKLIHLARRLYSKHPSNKPSTKSKQDLARRFATGYKLIKDRFPDAADIKALEDNMTKYQEELDKWALRDYQVNSLQIPYSKTLYTFVHGCIVLAIASIPSIILNAPVGMLASYWAALQAKKDLSASRVKVAARDVLTSKKIVFSIMAVPILWVTYALLLRAFTPLETRTIVVLFLCCPIFSYFGKAIFIFKHWVGTNSFQNMLILIGVTAVEAGMVDIKDLRPVFLRLLPSFREQQAKLPEQRVALQEELRIVVKKYGPDLGSLYFDKEVQWDQYLNPTTSSGKEKNAGVDDASANTTPIDAVKNKDI